LFRRLLIGLAVFAALATPTALIPSATASGSGPIVVQTNMYGSNEVPPVQSPYWGFFRFYFNEDRSAADVTVDVKGMTGDNVTSADIHRGAPGSDGPVVIHVADGGYIVTSRHVTFTPQELQEMASGEYYITLSTVEHPDGELRGQIEVPSGFLPAVPATATPAEATEPATTSSAPPPITGQIRPPNTGDGGLAAD
jgi:hypothetical protein